MLKRLVIAYLFMSICSSLFAATWDFKVVDSTLNYPGYSTSLALDSNNLPHVVYMGKDRYFSYASYNGSAWSSQLVSPPKGFIGLEGSLAIDTTDTPNIVFMAGQDLRFVKGANNAASVIASSISGFFDISLMLDSNNTPHIAYRDGSGDPSLWYAVFKASIWDKTEVYWGNPAGYGASIGLDNTQNPVITFFDNINGLRSAWFKGSDWAQGAIDNVGKSHFSSMAVDSNNRIHVVYYDSINKDLKYCMYYGGMTTNLQTIDSAGDVGQYCSMVRDSIGTIHIAYFDATNNNLKYAVSNGSSWNIETIKNNANIGYYAGVGNSIKLDSRGDVHISTLRANGSQVYYFKGTVNPAVEITSPSTDDTYTTSNPSFVIGGSVSSSVTSVKWSNGSANGDCSLFGSSWSATIPLSEGPNNIIITGYKTISDFAQDSITVTYVNGPQIMIMQPTNQTNYETNTPEVIVGGQVNGPNSIKSVSWQNGDINGKCSGTTSFKTSKIKLNPGENDIVITAKDSKSKLGSRLLVVTYIDDVAPVLTIKSPTSKTTYTTTKAAINISGTAIDADGIKQVLWTNKELGTGGVCTGTKSWKVSNVALGMGSQHIIISTEDLAGNLDSAALLVTRTDNTKPKITILTPTSKSTLTTFTTLMPLSGTASDNIAISSVTWESSTGDSGTANGTVSWSIGAINLVKGKNVIKVKAADTTGNFTIDTLTVTLK